MRSPSPSVGTSELSSVTTGLGLTVFECFVGLILGEGVFKSSIVGGGDFIPTKLG